MRRTEGGYEVLDKQTLEMTVAADRHVKGMIDACRQPGGHRPHPEYPEVYETCGKPL